MGTKHKDYWKILKTDTQEVVDVYASKTVAERRAREDEIVVAVIPSMVEEALREWFDVNSTQNSIFE